MKMTEIKQLYSGVIEFITQKGIYTNNEFNTFIRRIYNLPRILPHEIYSGVHQLNQIVENNDNNGEVLGIKGKLVNDIFSYAANHPIFLIEMQSIVDSIRNHPIFLNQVQSSIVDSTCYKL